MQVGLGACALVVIAVGAFVAYRKYLAAPPPPPPRPVVTSKPVPGPKKSEALPAAPAPSAQQPRPTATTAKPAPPPATRGSKSSAVSTPPPPVVAAATVQPAGPPAPAGPSPSFRAFVDQLKIGGFRVGPPARLFLGGVTYTEGDVIDQDLGVIFAGVDSKTGEVVFKDGSGAKLRRQF